MASTIKWEEAERIFWRILLLCAAIGAPPTYYWFGPKGTAFYVLGTLAFALEFKLLILVVRLLVGTLNGNPLAIGSVVLGKLGVWLALAGSPFWLPSGMRIPFGIGCGIFALSLLALLIVTGGRPRLENR